MCVCERETRTQSERKGEREKRREEKRREEKRREETSLNPAPRLVNQVPELNCACALRAPASGLGSLRASASGLLGSLRDGPGEEKPERLQRDAAGSPNWSNQLEMIDSSVICFVPTTTTP